MMAVELLDVLSKLPGAMPLQRQNGQLWMDAPDLDVLAMARAMVEFEGRLRTMTGVAISGGETILLYHFLIDAEEVVLAVHTHGNAIQSITPVARSAEQIEREIHDLFSVRFVGHPNLDRIVPPPDVHEGFFHE